AISTSLASSSIRDDASGNSINPITSGFTTSINYYSHGSGSRSSSYAEILQCLYTSTYKASRDRIREPAQGTCIWVIEHLKYREWFESKTSGLLWLSADPGC